MRLASLKRLALGVGILVGSIHCSSDDDPQVADASVEGSATGGSRDASADARDASAGGDTGGSAGSGTGGGGAGGGTLEAGVDSVAPDGSAGASGAIDAGADGTADGPRVDAADARGEAEAATPSAEASADTGVVDAPAVPVVDAGLDSAEATAPTGDAGVTFAQVRTVFAQNCANCHSAGNAAQRIDLITPAGLYARLTGPLPSNYEGFCNVDGGVDGGGDALHAVVPGDPSASYLYRKIVAVPPAICGQRMPRVGSSSSSIGCDVAEADGGDFCLSQEDIDLIGKWIEADAPND